MRATGYGPRRYPGAGRSASDGAAGNPSTRTGRSRGVVGEHLHVGPGRAAVGAPGQQRFAQRADARRAPSSTTRTADNPTQRVPSGASVTAARPTAPPRSSRTPPRRRRPRSARRRARRADRCAATRRRGGGDRSTGRVGLIARPTSRTRTVPCVRPWRRAAAATAGRARPASGVRPRRCVPVDDRRRTALCLAETSSGTAEFARECWPRPAAAASRPATAVRRRARPAAAACSSARIWEVRTGASAKYPQRDDVGGGDSTTVAAFGAHPHRRADRQQMADDVGQRRDRSGGQPVAQP